MFWFHTALNMQTFVVEVITLPGLTFMKRPLKQCSLFYIFVPVLFTLKIYHYVIFYSLFLSSFPTDVIAILSLSSEKMLTLQTVKVQQSPVYFNNKLIVLIPSEGIVELLPCFLFSLLICFWFPGAQLIFNLRQRMKSFYEVRVSWHVI